MVPKFCPIHLKIHVCDEQNLSNINKKIDEELGSKVRRLHGTQTEEELRKIAEKVNAPAKKGTLQWILEHAKKENNKVKSQLYGDSSSSPDEMTKGISDKELNNRVALLKNKLASGGTVHKNQIKNNEKKIESSNNPNRKLTFQEIVQIAKQKNENPNRNKEYVPPKRSNIQPQRKSILRSEERTIYQTNSLNILESEIKRAKEEQCDCKCKCNKK